LGTAAPCDLVPGSGPGGGGTGGGGGPGGSTTGLSAAGGCLLRSFKVVGSTKLRTVLKRGLRVRAGGCLKTASDDVSVRRVSIALAIDRKLAKRLRLVKRAPKKAYVIARASKRLTGVADTTIVVRFGKRVRKALGHTRRLKLAVGISVKEGSTQRTVTRRVTLKR
jgi:hypothetical protein